MLPATVCDFGTGGNIECFYETLGRLLLTFYASLFLVSASRSLITGGVLIYETGQTLWAHLYDDID
jgi:hypothetical protein